ncbi:MAG: hypothetical protein GXO79_06500 [Chlorobi bacterium]|nr:hypothetical protein [Chlorobiota bacterium]
MRNKKNKSTALFLLSILLLFALFHTYYHSFVHHNHSAQFANYEEISNYQDCLLAKFVMNNLPDDVILNSGFKHFEYTVQLHLYFLPQKEESTNFSISTRAPPAI